MRRAVFVCAEGSILSAEGVVKTADLLCYTEDVEGNKYKVFRKGGFKMPGNTPKIAELPMLIDKSCVLYPPVVTIVAYGICRLIKWVKE